jgi:hypothetical protein
LPAAACDAIFALLFSVAVTFDYFSVAFVALLSLFYLSIVMIAMVIGAVKSIVIVAFGVSENYAYISRFLFQSWISTD